MQNQETKTKNSEHAKKRFSDPTKNTMYGKKHTEQSKKKMSIAKQTKII